MKHMKTLGPMVVSVLALAAVFGTASASAHTPAEFTASAGGLNFKETTVALHKIDLTGGEAICDNISFGGTTSGTTAYELNLHPSYGECEAFGFPATVSVTNCKLSLNASGEAKWHKTDTAAGAEACSIHIEVNNFFAKCKVTITEQTTPNAVSVANSGGGTDIILKFNGSAHITDHVTESSGLCPLAVGTHTNSHYNGESTVQVIGGTLQWDPTKP